MILDASGRPFSSEALQRREDRWENYSTGLGTGIDKTTHGRFMPSRRIMDQEIRDLRDGSDIVARVIEDRPHEMFREGYDLVGRIRKEKKSGSPTDAATDIPESDTNDLREYAEEQFALDSTIEAGLVEGRSWGGALDVMGVDDGGMPWEPVNEDRIQSFDFLSLVDRRYAYVQSQYAKFNAPGKKYGTAEIYLISNAIAGTGWNDRVAAPGRPKTGKQLEAEGADIQFVHESRCIRFDGNTADLQTRSRLGGWSWSVVQRVYDVLRQFEQAFDSVGYLLSDASQAVYKIQGLYKAFAAGRRSELLDRALLMEQTRGVLRGILLDAGGADGKAAESFERSPTPFGSIPDLIDRFMMRFAAAAKMPCSLLFGRAPQGLNATGESEIRTWYDSVRSDAQKNVAPRLKRVYRLLALSKNSPIKGKRVDWTIDFRPLWSPSSLEVAQAQASVATSDASYIDAGVVSPEEVALGLRDKYPHLDFAAREKAIKQSQSFDPHENDEPDPNEGQGEPLGQGAPVPTLGPSESPEAGGERKGPDPDTDGKGDRADFDPDQPRESNGQWGAGGGGASTPSGGDREAVAGGIRGAFAKASAAIRGASAKLGHAAVQAVKSKVAEFSHAAQGVKAFLAGHEVTEEQKSAIKKVALQIAATIVASHVAPLLPIAHVVHGELARKALEKIGHKAVHHVLEKLGAKGLHVDAADADPESWLGQVIAEAVADALDEEGDSYEDHADAWNPDQPRGHGGRLSEERATAQSRGANAATAYAAAFGGHEPNRVAANAHRQAAAVSRELAGKHEALGNSRAAAKSRASAEKHEQLSAGHLAKSIQLRTVPAGRPAASAAPEGARRRPFDRADADPWSPLMYRVVRTATR